MVDVPKPSTGASVAGSSATEFRIVYMSTPMSIAASLARNLVEQKLAACVNIIPAVRSVYAWKGEVQDEEESMLIIKTRASLMTELIDFAKKEHPYEVPELLSLPLLEGNPPYIQWLHESIRDPSEDAWTSDDATGHGSSGGGGGGGGGGAGSTVTAPNATEVSAAPATSSEGKGSA